MRQRGLGKKHLFFYLKVSVAIIVFALIVRHIHPEQLRISFSKVHLAIYAIVVLLNLTIDIFAVFQLQVILRALNVKRSVGELLTVNFVSYLYSFLGEISAGAVRWYRIAGKDKRRGESVFAIGVERIQLMIGLFCLFVAVYFMKESRYFALAEKNIIIAFMIGMGLFLFAAMMILFNDPCVRFLKKILGNNKSKFVAVGFLGEKMLDIVRILDVFRKNKGTFNLSLFYSLLYVASNTVMIDLLLKAVGITVSGFDVVWIVVFMRLVSMVPISIYGLGINQGVAIYLLGKYGISTEQALVYGLLAFSLYLVKTAAGGVVELFIGWRLYRSPDFDDSEKHL